jgi:hypothetical protein
MEGDRITALKRTLHLLVDALEEKDMLTLITYCDKASVVAKCVPISLTDTVSMLHQQIDTLNADGGTNMEAAILALREMDTPVVVDAVFILTDGHINQGITGSSGLLTLLNHSIPSGTPVNTLGFGADVNARMLRDMAMRTCGSYTFADKDELLPAIIGDIVGGLQSTVGRQGRLTIPEGWTCCELGPVEDTMFITGNLIAEKTQWVVLSAPALWPAALFLPPITFTWRVGLLTHMIGYTANRVGEIDVAAQRDRCRVAKAFQEATEELELGTTSRARAILLSVKAELDTSIAKDTTFVVQLYAQIDQMIEELRTVSPAVVSSRMASGGATLSLQRGIMSGGGDPRAFSSPLQANTQERMTTRYTQVVEEVDEVSNDIIETERRTG